MFRLLKDVNTLAVVCSQWGDTGKGKIVDLFADWADVIARGTGGANAGHTIEADGKTVIVHLVPSGVVRPDKMNVIGSGVAVDPRQLVKELEELRENGIDCTGRLMIAHNAKLVLPSQIAVDRMNESVGKKGKIGTTGRGMGPVYAQFADRSGLFVNDLLNRDTFARRLKQNLIASRALIRGYDQPDTFKKIMHHESLASGMFYSADQLFAEDAIIESYLNAANHFHEMIADTDALMRGWFGKKNILLEGAQGLFLSIDYGTYPFVTSSDCSDQGLAKGVGLPHRAIDLTLAIVKAFYMTRVGEGPFPTEMGGHDSEVWCGNQAAELAKRDGFKTVREMEKAQFGNVRLDDPDEFKQGIAIRIEGDEYGATTRRPRRDGWLDLPLLRYAKAVAGYTDTILTKLDVLDKCPVIKLCVSYTYKGPTYSIGQRVLQPGDILETAIPNAEVLEHCRPNYLEFPGWMTSTRDLTSEDDFPRELADIIKHTERATGTHPLVFSVGPDRNHTIFRK